MNNNVKNAAIGLMIMGAGTGAIWGISQILDKDAKKNKFELFTTDPQKAQEALDIENLSSSALFEAERKMYYTDSVKNEKDKYVQKLQKYADKYPDEKEYMEMCIAGLNDKSLNIVTIKNYLKDKGISLEDSIK